MAVSGAQRAFNWAIASLANCSISVIGIVLLKKRVRPQVCTVAIGQVAACSLAVERLPVFSAGCPSWLLQACNNSLWRFRRRA